MKKVTSVQVVNRISKKTLEQAREHGVLIIIRGGSSSNTKFVGGK